jgi:hypothetical protein
MKHLIVLFVAALGLDSPLAQAATTSVAIMPVEQWGGTRSVIDAQAGAQAITHITLHHMGETFALGRDPLAYLRNLQSWSRATKHWSDIPYHYIIDLDGHVYEGRDIRVAGDTNTEYDPHGHALIEVVGNFEEVEPNSAQLEAVVALTAQLADKYGVPAQNIASHRDFSKQTVCPGKNLYRYVENGFIAAQVAQRRGQL